MSLNKTPRLSPTGIEYGDYAWNFASGCGNNSEGRCNSGGFNCWAYPITQRFTDRYPNGFNPTIYPEALLSPLYLKKPSRILCAFMGDLFWDCPEFDPNRIIPTGRYDGNNPCAVILREEIWSVINQCPQHTFLFLTKQPQNLIKWSPFPDNCQVGVTITHSDSFLSSIKYLYDVEATTKFISFEPFLWWSGYFSVQTLADTLRNYGIKWVIIGSQTKPYKPPEISWVREIVEACDKAGVKVYLKNNLTGIIDTSMDWAFNKSGYRQELPGA